MSLRAFNFIIDVAFNYCYLPQNNYLYPMMKQRGDVYLWNLLV